MKRRGFSKVKDKSGYRQREIPVSTYVTETINESSKDNQDSVVDALALLLEVLCRRGILSVYELAKIVGDYRDIVVSSEKEEED
jgi:hypothetical protein